MIRPGTYIPYSELEKLIHTANDGNIKPIKYTEHVYLHRLPEDIYCSWPDLVYLIKYDEKFVGIVYQIASIDLQVFTLPEYRRQGHMKRAFEEGIFPYMFDKLGIAGINFEVEPSFDGFPIALGFRGPIVSSIDGRRYFDMSKEQFEK
ncbi:hypothetical protein KQI65_01930 [bacterium]|nr:hypothetical protein [bacterium]